MKSWELEKMWKQEGIEEGLAQGLEQGLAQGLEQGLEQGLSQGLTQGLTQGSIALIETCQEFHLSKEETLNRVMQKFNLDENTATAYIEKYWKD